ncbi:hypothetical protein NM688_g9108 [Phlebia brevispora]|uniref:Uncharacterized protein n=1 Tax=Phlebia brevispora TaxID=194682 RepID=A0ACC1RMW4_9APHY|nr:hypothetical protein NM688_g9108 [Phlebia brevispora]
MEDSNKTRIQEFYATFQAARTDLSSRLEALKAGGQPDSDKLHALVADAAKLRKEFIDANGYLPTYDQRQYEQFLKSVEADIESLRVTSAPKPKFAFKRRPPKASTPSTAQTCADHAKEAPILSAPPTSSSSHLALSGHSHKYLDGGSLPSLASSSDLTISDLEDCIVNLLTLPSLSDAEDGGQCKFTALHARNLSNTVLILPVFDGSALLHDLKRCTIALGCHQFRMHASHAVDVYLSIESNPIIEHCSSIRFAEYPRALSSTLDASPSILHETSKHLAVQDFSHIRATRSPNWSALPAEALPSGDDWGLVVRRDTSMSRDDMEEAMPRLLPAQQ